MKTMRLIEYCILLLVLLTACLPSEAVVDPSPEIQVILSTGTAVVISDMAALRPLPDIQTPHVAIVARDTHLNVTGHLADESWYQVAIPTEVVWQEIPAGITSVWVAAPFVELDPVVEDLPVSEPTVTDELTPPHTPTATSTPAATATLPAAETTPLPTTTPCVLPPGWVIHTVRAGDTLGRLAPAVGATVTQLMQANCLETDRILAGQALYVPRLPPPPPDTPTSTNTPLPPATATATNTPLPPPPEEPDTPTPTNTPISPTLIPEP
jgi:LysM repeat protein